MFDHNKKVTLVGSVKEFQYTNPHSWLQVMVQDGGKSVLWGFEAEGPSTPAARRHQIDHLHAR